MLEQKIPGNFKTLWLKYDVSCSDKHQLFIKEHSVRNQEPGLPKGRTLFVLNVPPYVSKDSLKRTFMRHWGTVTNVRFQSALENGQNGFKSAYVVFAKDSSLKKALGLPKDFTVSLEDEESRENPMGTLKWYKEYNEAANVDEAADKLKIQEALAEYDRRVQERLLAQSNQEDEDGWITVSSKKKRGQFAPSRKESTIDRVQSREMEKNKKTELRNFYRHQIREKKMKQLAELRKKLEMSKQQIQQMKTKRTFKPFG